MTFVINRLWGDESGDSGFRFENGSSQHLVLSLVYTRADSEDAIVRAVQNLKMHLNVPLNFEFKFSRIADRYRHAFLETIQTFDWEYKAIVADKKHIQAPALINHPHQLYCEMLRRMLYDNDPSLEKAILTIDETVAKIHHHEFNSVLKQYISRNTIRKIRQERSRGSTMIQVADMISASIFRKYERSDSRYWDIIKHKQKILIEF